MQAEGAAVVDNEVALVSRTENVHGLDWPRSRSTVGPYPSIDALKEGARWFTQESHWSILLFA